MGYILPAVFVAAMTGVDLRPLPPGEVQNYINRSSNAIDKFCGWSFGPNGTFTEKVSSNAYGRAQIDSSGFLSIYPIQVHPINSFISLTWIVRTPSQPNTKTLITPSTVMANDVDVDTDSWGDGYRIRVYEDFSSFRDPGIPTQFTLSYNGGYVVTPTWLEEATIRWTAGMLKQRGAQAAVMTGTGGMVDVSAIGSDIVRAQEILSMYQRKF